MVKMIIESRYVNQLIDFAKTFTMKSSFISKRDSRIIPIQCTYEPSTKELTCEMANNYTLGVLTFPVICDLAVTQSMMLEVPTKKFRGGIDIELLLDDKQAIWNSDTISYNLELPNVASKFDIKRCIKSFEQNHSDKDIEISFDVDILTKSLKAFDKSNGAVTLRCSGNSQAMEITQGNNKAYVLPVMRRK